MKKFVSIKTHLIFYLIPILLITFIFISVFFLKFSFNIIKEEYVSSMKFTLKNVSNTLDFPLWANDKKTVENTLAELRKNKVISKIEIYKGEEVFYIYENHSEKCTHKDIVLKEKIIGESSLGGPGFSINQEKNNYITITLCQKKMKDEISKYGNYFVGFLILIGFIVFILAYFFIDSLTMPIIHLANEIATLGKTNFTKKIEINRNDEIGMLARSFEKMRKDIHDYSQKLKNWNEELEKQVNLKTDELNVSNQTLSATVTELEVINRNYKEINETLNETMTELSKAKNEAETANRMKTQFVSMISHELRTPLTSIIGYTQLIQTKILGNINKKQMEGLTTVEVSAKDLLKLINDIIDISKVDLRKFSIKLEEQNIKEFMEKIEKETIPLIKSKNLKFITQYRYFVTAGFFDSLRIKQVITNLIGNAVKFTEKGSITLEVMQTNSMKYNKKPSTGGKYLQVSVIDTGSGIKAEDLDKIWDLFYQVDNKLTRKKGGTGLGLSISRQIITLHKGRFLVESKYGEGSKFSFVIPLAPEPG